MMQTPARNFDRVLRNVRGLVAARKASRGRRPSVNLQFLVWRGNYKTIPQMYALARDLGVDTILFNGLSFLPTEQHMTEDEVAEMLGLYEEVVRIDEFRRITNISSYERNIEPEINAMVQRLSAERRTQSRWRRALAVIQRTDFSLREKISHHRRMNRKLNALAAGDEACIIGWYSMLVRSDGSVGPCCILQQKKLGNIFRQPLREVWNSEAYQQFRRELTGIIRDGERWNAGATDQTVEGVCALKGDFLCPMKTFYFSQDRPFASVLTQTFGDLRTAARLA
jgi:MoaA/NifB/PqqE/SkfB family radical SAM enzyme